jgi:LexA-binding, inner membrane-associated putative hydrolase
MFPVGHLSIGLIIAYFCMKKLSLHRISIPLVMLLSIAPDVDIFFQLAGIGSHKSITHSAILCALLASIFIAKYGKPALIYSLAYLQHIIIGDIMVGPINLLYPFGNLSVDIGIKYGSLLHILLELSLSICMLWIILYDRRRSRYLFEFAYRRADLLVYCIVLLSLIVSFTYIIYGDKYLLLLFKESGIRLSSFILSYLLTIIAIVLLCIHSRPSQDKSWMMLRE